MVQRIDMRQNSDRLVADDYLFSSDVLSMFKFEITQPLIVPNFNFTTIIVTLDLSTIALLHNGCVQHYIFTRILMSDGFCLQQCAGATFASLAAWACLARPRLGPTWLPSQIYQCSVKPLILKHKTIPPSKKLGLITKLNPEMDPPDCTGLNRELHSWLKID